MEMPSERCHWKLKIKLRIDKAVSDIFDIELCIIIANSDRGYVLTVLMMLKHLYSSFFAYFRVLPRLK